MKFIVKLANALSPTGVAFIGPEKCSGFKVDQECNAFQFETRYEADDFAQHFQGRWRGFHGGADIQVICTDPV